MNGTPIDKSTYSIYNLYDNYNYYSQDSSSDTNKTLSDLPEVHFTNHTTFLSMVENLLGGVTKQNDSVSDIYENIFKHHDIDTILGTLSFKQRCDLYFKNVFSDNVNWIFNPEHNYDIKNDGDDFKKLS